MASTDYPLSVSSKFIDDAGTEHLVTVRGRNLDDFQGRLNEAGHIFPYAGFRATAHITVTNAEVGAGPTQVDTPPPTPITSAPTTSIPPDMNRTPANHPDRAPKCGTHNSQLRPSKDGGWFCPRKNDDGTYCQVRAA